MSVMIKKKNVSQYQSRVSVFGPELRFNLRKVGDLLLFFGICRISLAVNVTHQGEEIPSQFSSFVNSSILLCVLEGTQY